ncbi:dihydrofolate reductase [Pseudobythopirellula maris]|nr:dihydrofolate reductase [Pseudobythopirellula maris]
MPESKTPKIAFVAAASDNDVIGRDGDLPWRQSTDLRRFKRETLGHTLVMGRKSYEAIGEPLPGRATVVLTRNTDWSAGEDRVRVAADLDQALELVATWGAELGMNPDVAMVTGGGQIFEMALPRADRLLLTRIHVELEGDAFFPRFDESAWRLAESLWQPADAKNDHAFTFETWLRK